MRLQRRCLFCKQQLYKAVRRPHHFRAACISCLFRHLTCCLSVFSECTGGRVFMECGPSCQLTCEDKQSSRDCSAACVRGCHCPAGTVLGRRSCVEIRDCPCRIGAMYYAAASQVTINNEIWFVRCVNYIFLGPFTLFNAAKVFCGKIQNFFSK